MEEYLVGWYGDMKFLKEYICKDDGWDLFMVCKFYSEGVEDCCVVVNFLEIFIF